MEIQAFTNLLSCNAYPGRGIAIGRSFDKKSAVIVYFIMGRSTNSRNRIFVKTKDGIKTQAFDESKLKDPSLIIYTPVRKYGAKTIVTNGDQTDTIYDALVQNHTIEEALSTRKFEPDSPNFTPRISCLLDTTSRINATFSILKAQDSTGTNCNRFYYKYEDIASGTAYFIHTYSKDGDPLPAFTGEPELCSIKGDIEEFSKAVWQALNNENRVSLFVEYIDLATKESTTRIINKNNKSN